MHPVFISYSSKDAKHAVTICRAVEARGADCWIASRDVAGGGNFQEAISTAISQAKIMILVFSSNTNNSDEIKKELALASKIGLVVIPVRIEDVLPLGAFAYELSTRQWIDLFADWEAAMERLTARISAVLGQELRPGVVPAKRGLPVALIVAVLAAIVAASGGAFYWQQTCCKPPLPTPIALDHQAPGTEAARKQEPTPVADASVQKPPEYNPPAQPPRAVSPIVQPETLPREQQIATSVEVRPPAVPQTPPAQSTFAPSARDLQSSASAETKTPEAPASSPAGVAPQIAQPENPPAANPREQQTALNVEVRPAENPTLPPSNNVVPSPDSTPAPFREAAIDPKGDKAADILLAPLKDIVAGGRTFRDCEDCPSMVVITPGSFRIGSPANESGHDVSEGPRREVQVAQSFAISQDAISFAQWDACVAEGGCGSFIPGDMTWGRGQRPAILVSWKDAKAFVDWLSRKTGQTYRLPSEAEWEYATRACRSTVCQDAPFWFGDAISPERANYDWRYAYRGSQKAQALRKTAPIGSYGPNPFGLFNAVGNVAQWMEDCWNDDLKTLPTDGTPRLSGDCSAHVVRGGSWKDEPVALRSAARTYDVATSRQPNIGFRVARVLPK